MIIKCCVAHRKVANSEKKHSQDGRIHDLPDVYITGVNEPYPCKYEVHVCAAAMCEDPISTRKKDMIQPEIEDMKPHSLGLGIHDIAHRESLALVNEASCLHFRAVSYLSSLY